MLAINLSKDSERFLSRLPAKQQRQIARRLLALQEQPSAPDTKQLQGFPEYRRVDTGEYRIIYRVAPPLLFIALIGKRNDDEVYRRFTRKAR
jgi:mRNA interferase RelE/StbE